MAGCASFTGPGQSLGGACLAYRGILAALQNLVFSRSTGGRLLGYGACTFEADGQAGAVIDYIPYPEQLYLEIYYLLYPGEAGEDADAGEDPGTRAHGANESLDLAVFGRACLAEALLLRHLAQRS